MIKDTLLFTAVLLLAALALMSCPLACNPEFFPVKESRVEVPQ